VTRRTSPNTRADAARAAAASRLGIGSTNAVLLLMALYTLIPLWWLLVSATKGLGYLNQGSPLWFSHFDLGANIARVFSTENGIFGTWVLNSLIYSVGGATVSTLVSAMAGFALAKYRFRGREAVFNVILAAVLIPAPMLALPLFLLMAKLHLTNTYLSVLLPGFVSPFGVYLARVYASASVPDELLEAARIDGAGEARSFFGVAVPVMAPALVTVFLFQFVGIWNNYLLPSLMLNDSSLQPLTVGLVRWRSEAANGIPSIVPVTASFLSLIPLVIAFLALQRFWRSGLTAGSLK
jgi:multiple sugar transport system permease protein